MNPDISFTPTCASTAPLRCRSRHLDVELQQDPTRVAFHYTFEFERPGERGETTAWLPGTFDVPDRMQATTTILRDSIECRVNGQPHRSVFNIIGRRYDSVREHYEDWGFFNLPLQFDDNHRCVVDLSLLTEQALHDYSSGETVYVDDVFLRQEMSAEAAIPSDIASCRVFGSSHAVQMQDHEDPKSTPSLRIYDYARESFLETDDPDLKLAVEGLAATEGRVEWTLQAPRPGCRYNLTILAEPKPEEAMSPDARYFRDLGWLNDQLVAGTLRDFAGRHIAVRDRAIVDSDADGKVLRARLLATLKSEHRTIFTHIPMLRR